MSWTSSDDISSLATALVVALGEMSDVPKKKEAKIETRGGGSYGYRYADLGDALGLVKPALAKNGIAVMQSATSPDHDSVAIWTTLLHATGQWMTFGPLALPAGRTAQETGSAITYGRRYALLAALGLATEDDDGASAGRRYERPKSTAPRTDAEAEIRSVLAALPRDRADGLKSAFRSTWGALVSLDPAQHEEALKWVLDRVSAGEVTEDE